MQFLMQGHDLAQVLCPDHTRNQGPQGECKGPSTAQAVDQISGNVTYYSTLDHSKERQIVIEVKHSKDDHVTSHATGKTWIFPMKAIWGAKFHRRADSLIVSQSCQFSSPDQSLWIEFLRA